MSEPARRGRPRKYNITTEKSIPARVLEVQSEPLPALLTPDQAASVLQVSSNTIRARCEDGTLPAIDIGEGESHLWRIYRDRILPDGDPAVSTAWKQRALRAEAIVAGIRGFLSAGASEPREGR